MDQKTITVSFSELDQWRKCPMAHYLGYRQRQPRREGRAASRGTLWHTMQQMFWDGMIAGEDRAKLMHEIPGIVLNWEPITDNEVDDMDILLWMWDGFALDYWNLASYTPVATEFEHIWELPRIPEQPEWLTIKMKCYIDLLMRDNRTNRLFPLDHKSTAELNKIDGLAKDMDVDDQVGIYLATCREIVRVGALDKVLGPFNGYGTAIWSYAITSKLKTKPTKANPSGINERPMEARYWKVPSSRTNAHLDTILREASLTTLDAYRRPLDTEPPRAPDKDKCRWRCDHRDICFYARSTGRRVQLLPSVKGDQLPEGILALDVDNQSIVQ